MKSLEQWCSAMADTSEEKTLPASDKKLADARKKGQVAKAGDLVSAAVVAGIVLLVGGLWPSWGERLQALTDAMVRASAAPGDLLPALVEAGAAWMELALPVLLVASVLALVAGVAATGGPLFAMEAIKPKPDAFSPAAALKRIFGVRAWVEIGKSLVKVVVLVAAFVSVIQLWLGPLIEVPACGFSCFGPMLVAMLRTTAHVAAGVFVIIGIADILLQRRLFLREMRMTKTEMKQEQKNQEGDPHMLAERRRLRQEQARMPARLGLAAASLVITDGKVLVGLRYTPEEGVPAIVYKARGALVARALEEAQGRGLPIVPDVEADVVAGLAAHGLGEPLRENLFRPVAMMLVRAGAL